MGSVGSEPRRIEWQTDALDLVFVLNGAGVICLRSLLTHGTPERPSASELFDKQELPFTSIRLAGEGNGGDKTAKSLVGGTLSARLRYENHRTEEYADRDVMEIVSRDEKTKVKMTNRLTIYKSVPVLRALAEVVNESELPITVTQLSSLTVGGLTKTSKEWWSDFTLSTATNGWFREAQWRNFSLPDIGIDENGICQLADGHTSSQATFGLSSSTSFSTGSYLPMGLLQKKDETESWLWQVENNGSWRWEIGDFKDSVYLAAGGPTSDDHEWKARLAPGESFTSVPVACTYTSGGLDSAFSALTAYRRRIRRDHPDNDNLPIIFNDYMNCLMGDPDEDKIKALLDPVARSGAEYFVIDAGWYADDSNWWDDVGLWEPSKKRFPSGFKNLLDTIRSKGLIPGVWMEPEVVGVRSVVGKMLPEDAFFQEDGCRMVERGRFQLDYRHPEVRKRMDAIVQKLVVDYGVGYFKFDYNIEVTHGTDANTTSRGAAHLEHQRTYLAWVRDLLDRYPDLVIESCSSGAQRMDYAMLAVHPLQSTSDQQDPVLYAAIAAAAPTAVVPEQSATWSYPQPEWSDEINALTVVNSLLGRVHLSGRLDNLSSDQYALVKQGMDVYKNIRQDLKQATPIWPLGLPKWHDDWICLGMRTASGGIYLSVWRRGGNTTAVNLPLKQVRSGASVRAQLLYPAKFEASCHWNSDKAVLEVRMPQAVCARLFYVEIAP